MPSGPNAGVRMLLPNIPHDPSRSMTTNDVALDSMRLGTFEQGMHDALAAVSLEGKTVWDVGAHIGYQTLAFAKRVGPSGRVVAFEPNPFNLERLRANVGANASLATRITALPCALGDAKGRESFIASPDVDGGATLNGFFSALSPRPMNEAERACVRTVDVYSGDAIVAEGLAPAPDFIKMDVELAEERVVHGLGVQLAARGPALLIEVHRLGLLHRLERHLRGLGYVVDMAEEDPPPYPRCRVLAQKG